MKVYVLIAEHQTVPGVVIEVHATKASADASKLELVRVMLKDAHRVAIALAPDTVDRAIESLQDEFGAAHCYVEISEHEVKGGAA